MFLAVLVSAMTTEAIGIHALFGAFLLGAILPHDGRIAREFTAKLKDPVTVLLLPAFFAYTGMRTKSVWSAAPRTGSGAAITLVATVGEVRRGDDCGPAHRTVVAGLHCAGALMNTRGLMELIAAQHRVGFGGDQPGAVRHDGDHGPDHHGDDESDRQPSGTANTSNTQCRPQPDDLLPIARDDVHHATAKLGRTEKKR